MSHATQHPRNFKVHARHLDGHQARVLEEVSFEAAAIAYVEDFDLTAPVSDDHQVSIVVQDVETGHQHCFKIDLDSGDASPCG
jgi:hypothetical protein